jgi:hypothetical protein
MICQNRDSLHIDNKAHKVLSELMTAQGECLTMWVIVGENSNWISCEKADKLVSCELTHNFFFCNERSLVKWNEGAVNTTGR